MMKPWGRFFPIIAIRSSVLVFAILLIGLSTPTTVRATNISVTLSPSSGVAPLTVKVICQATSIDSVISKYSIDFGDGTSDSYTTGQASHIFTHTYSAGLFEPVCTLYLASGTTLKSNPVRLIVAKWRLNIGSPIDSSPALSPDGTTLYIGADNGNLYAIDPATGTELWHYHTTDRIRSSPAVGSDGTIYFGSLDGDFYALSPNGSLKWSYASIGSAIFSTPAISADDILYFGASDGYLYSLTSSGTERWRFKTDGAIVSSPAIGNNGIQKVVYFGSTDQHVYAVYADSGELEWKFSTNAPVYSSPAIASTGRIYVGECQTGSAETYHFKFYCLNIDGTERWDIDTGTGVYASPAIGPDGTIYVGSWDGTFYALNPNTGKTIWSKAVYRSFNSSPAVGTSYESNGIIFVGCKDDNFYALQAPSVEKDYRRDWTFKTGESINYSSPVIGPGGTVYFASTDGYLYAINPSNPSLGSTSTSLASSPWPMFHGETNHDGLAKNIALPAVVSTSPAYNATNVDINTTQIEVKFSPAITSADIDSPPPFTLTEGSGADKQTVTGYAVTQENGNYTTVTFVNQSTPQTLAYSTTYTASIDYTAPSTQTTKTYSWSFTTEDQPTKNPSPDAKPTCFISTAAQ